MSFPIYNDNTSPGTRKSFYVAADPVKYRVRRKIETLTGLSREMTMNRNTQLLGQANVSRNSIPWACKSFYLAADPTKYGPRRKIETFDWAFNQDSNVSI